MAALLFSKDSSFCFREVGVVVVVVVGCDFSRVNDKGINVQGSMGSGEMGFPGVSVRDDASRDVKTRRIKQNTQLSTKRTKRTKAGETVYFK